MFLRSNYVTKLKYFFRSDEFIFKMRFTSKDELSASGSSTKPLQIPDSPFWVMTNSNTTRKKMMLTKASLMLGYTNEDAEEIRDLL